MIEVMTIIFLIILAIYLSFISLTLLGLIHMAAAYVEKRIGGGSSKVADTAPQTMAHTMAHR